MFDQIIEFLKTNHFASGGLLVAGLGMLYQNGRSYLNWGRAILLRKITNTVTITNADSGVYKDIEEWATKELGTQRKNVPAYTLSTTYNHITHEYEEAIPSPISGQWILKTPYGRLFLTMSRREDKRENGTTFFDSISITCFRWNTSNIFKYISSYLSNDARKTRQIFTTYCSNDHNATRHFLGMQEDICSPGTVILDDGIAEDFISDLNLFYKSRERYRELDIPYKRIYLIYGPPGTGKTSFIRNIVRYLNKQLIVSSVKDLSNPGWKILSKHMSKGIVVVEDIDRSILATRPQTGGTSTELISDVLVKSSEAFRTLLNNFDGVVQAHNSVIILTANDITGLDPALMRPGRIDKVYQFGYASKSQMKRLFLKFHPGMGAQAEEFASKLPDKQLSMARLQEHLVVYPEPSKALEMIEEIHKPS